MLSGHSSVLKLYACKFSDLCGWQFWLRRVKRVCWSVHLQYQRKTRELHLPDRGSCSTGRAVKILSGHLPVLKVYMCKFSDLYYMQFRLRRVKQVCCSVHYSSDVRCIIAVILACVFKAGNLMMFATKSSIKECFSHLPIVAFFLTFDGRIDDIEFNAYPAGSGDRTQNPALSSSGRSRGERRGRTPP